ncbi:hypothetical protein FACS1894137_14730 [Spirochaetia bacterium]|nr:hypothetical protein FACS1894137_14730 [Spirochaetia bacterium]
MLFFWNRKRLKNIPQDEWEQMPEDLKETLKKAAKSGAVIEHVSGSGLVKVVYGPLAARGYDMKTGQCVMMS